MKANVSAMDIRLTPKELLRVVMAFIHLAALHVNLQHRNKGHTPDHDELASIQRSPAEENLTEGISLQDPI